MITYHWAFALLPVNFSVKLFITLTSKTKYLCIVVFYFTRLAIMILGGRLERQSKWQTRQRWSKWSRIYMSQLIRDDIGYWLPSRRGKDEEEVAVVVEEMEVDVELRRSWSCRCWKSKRSRKERKGEFLKIKGFMFVGRRVLCRGRLLAPYDARRARPADEPTHAAGELNRTLSPSVRE